MKLSNFAYEAEDGKSIHVSSWLPDEELRALLLIVHGMAEHRQRYAPFAVSLASAGIGVYAPDLRGHGETAGSIKDQGFIAEEDGWELVVRDLHGIANRMATDHPGLPFFLFGHDVGSLFVRSYLVDHSEEVDGAVLSATCGRLGAIGRRGRRRIAREVRRNGKRSKSRSLDHLVVGRFNRAFRPNRTEFDWLTRDGGAVDTYVQDPYCGAVLSVGFFADLLDGLDKVTTRENIERMRRELPLLLVSGANDPFNNMGKQVSRFAATLRQSDFRDVELKLYPGCRHDCLYELNRLEVYDDVLRWLLDRIADCERQGQRGDATPAPSEDAE